MNYFVPFESVGNIRLGSRISEYTNKYSFSKEDRDDITGWETYVLEDKNISLFVEDGIINSIVCEAEFIFKGLNIIGLNIDDFTNRFNLKMSDREELYVNDDGDIQDVYDYDEIGLQVWCEQDEIKTVIVSAKW